MGNSNRLTRLYGSDAFLCLKIDDPALRKLDPTFLRQSLSEGIRLGSDLYHAWFIKEGTALFINTSLRHRSTRTCGLDCDEFFLWFIERHNPLEPNQSQTVGKWAKRMQLLWSTSIRGPCLDVENIQLLEDIIAPAYRHLPKAPAERDMTDGAGFMSEGLAHDIQAYLGLPSIPSAVQFRAAGYKGLIVLCISGHNSGEVRCIRLRSSQLKIKYRPEQLADRSLRTIDILSASTFRAPARLTAQVVMLLAENGVPNGILADLMIQALRTSLEPFVTSEATPIDMAYAIEDLGCIIAQRSSKAGNVIRGVCMGDDLRDREGGDEAEAHPGSFEESAYLCLLSGFNPKDSVYLRRKARDILKDVTRTITEEVRFKLERSVQGMIVPDPTGKLKPGEVFLQFQREYDIPNAGLVKVVTGDVLITRHPCKLPTDIQKMRAVDIEELRNLHDVIVMSTQGDRSPASMLGGGDYDGDLATVIWEPRLVEPFNNADPRFADQPAEFSKFLKYDDTTVAKLLEAIDGRTAREKRIEIQKYLLQDLHDDFQMQGYSTRHDVALYLLGGKHPKTIELAHKYAVSLDSSKTGVRVDPSVYRSPEDRTYDRQHPWKLEDERTRNSKFTLGRRATGLGPFVLDHLRENAETAERDLLKAYDTLHNPRPANGVFVGKDSPPDQDLCRPWQQLQQRQGRRFELARRAIMSRVQAAHRKYKEMNTEYAQAMDKGQPISRTRIERLNDVREFYRSGPPEEAWISVMSAEECRVYKASFCYIWDNQHGNGRGDFPFEMDHFTICAIKARASPSGPVTITGASYKTMRIHRRRVRSTMS
ncbi:hypothetical protein CALCODRAFT_486840 [Calocera cornea HHB12733]|uniref:RNA-dependent RNA polymerase n=1 Tax=Calocera cornea HHB12733 TaxID=1353952 RepID=A0A165DHY3_9BASI|nr:hypothetical protein CALCODRAFT_486840 [Calocera cornea HHB12733]